MKRRRQYVSHHERVMRSMRTHAVPMLNEDNTPRRQA
jgi:hypothetical protein